MDNVRLPRPGMLRVDMTITTSGEYCREVVFICLF